VPTVFKERGYRFFFYSDEGNEPCHVHVQGHGGEAKFWIPSVELVWSYHLNMTQLGQLRSILNRRRKEIQEHWHEHLSR